AQELRGPRGPMTDHHHVDAHRLEVARRVDQCLTLLHTRAARRHIDRIRRESLFRERERDAGAGDRLEEEIDDRLAPQCTHLLERPFADFLDRFRRVEDGGDLFAAEMCQPDEILAEQGGAHAAPSRLSMTESSPSSSLTLTVT